MVFYGWWTKTRLLAICFVLISYLMYLVGLYCIIVEDSAWTSEVSSHSPFRSSTVEALIVFCVALFLEKIYLTGLLYVQVMQEQFYFPGIGAVCAFFGILCFVFAGNLSISYGRELFSTAFPAIANVSSDLPASIRPKVILAFAGTLLNGLSWLFVVFLGMTKTHSFSQDTGLRMSQNKISNTCIYVSVRMVIFITALYYSVVNWNMLISNTFPDFVHSVYVMYLFFPYLISLSISECIGESRVTKGVVLSIISVFMTFVIKNLLNLAGTIYHCSSHWTQQCIEQNPVYYSTMISSGIAGMLLWMCISELWPNSGNNSSSSRDEPSDLPGVVLSLEEGCSKSSVI